MYISRTHINDLYMEFSHEKNKNICIIICDGLPTSNPSKKDLMLKLSNLWYSSIAPRYLWTWESYWNFLENPPTEDINNLINYISKNSLKDIYSWIEYDFSTMKYILLWSSFWWTIALNTLLNNKSISYAILLSPLLNLSQHNQLYKEQNLFELESFIRNAFWNAYRFWSKDRDSFCKWYLFDNDSKKVVDYNQQITIIYDQFDQDISHLSIEEFCNSSWITNSIIVDWYKHISYTKIDEKLINIINNEIQKHHSLSCGLIPINKKTNEILIVYDNENNWWFPKWLQIQDESRINTCKRECMEEIGISNIDFLDIEPIIVNYKFNKKDKLIHKTNILFFWYIKNNIYIDNKEIKDFKRVNIDELIKIIPYKDVIDKIKTVFKID